MAININTTFDSKWWLLFVWFLFSRLEFRCTNRTWFSWLSAWNKFNDAAAMVKPISIQMVAMVRYVIPIASLVFWMFVACYAADIAMRPSSLFVIVVLLWYLCVDFDIHFSLQSPIRALPLPTHCPQHHHQTVMFSQPV